MGKYIEYTLRGIFNILFSLNQKDSFWIAKGFVLGCKRTHFGQPKESFCKAKGLHFDYLKRHWNILYKYFILINKMLL